LTWRSKEVDLLLRRGRTSRNGVVADGRCAAYRPNALIYRTNIAGMVANSNQIPVWNIEDWKWKP
jgi:hypothetical protein